MPVHVIADRVEETTTTTGTGPVSLDGATSQAQAFFASVGDGNECDYILLSGNGTDWETGLTDIHYGVPCTLTRDQIISSTNGGSPIDLSGVSSVFMAPTAARLYGRFGRRSTRPKLTTLTWNNQGAAAAVDYLNGPITLTVPPVNGDQLRSLVTATITPPWTYTVEIEALPFNGSAFGLVLFDTVGKAVTLEAQFGTTPQWMVNHWNSSTSLNAPLLTTPLYPTTQYWCRIHNDGTTLTFLISLNGADWTTLGSEPVGSYLTTLSEIGIFAENNTAVSGAPYGIFSIWAYEYVSGSGSNVQWV